MPVQVLPDAEAFACFEEAMLKKGFRKIGGAEFTNDLRRLGLIAPRKREGREVGFTFHANGLKATVWTTYLEAEGEAREEDAGWVLICEGDTAQYFSHPLHRTKNFLPRLYKWAQVVKQRVEKRPLCPECQAFMHITQGMGLKSRFWKCRRTLRHTDRKDRNLHWDIGLSTKAVAFVVAERRIRHAYQKMRAAIGKPAGRALLKRKSWSITHQENTL